MFQIPTKIEPAYTAGNVLTLNQRKIQPALHRGNILSVNLKKTSSGHVQENPKRTQAYRHPEPAPVTPTVSSVSSAPQKHDIPVLRNVIQKGQKSVSAQSGSFQRCVLHLAGTSLTLSVISIYPLIFWMLQARFPAMTGLFFTDRH